MSMQKWSYGGNGGSAFDDGVQGTVDKIVLTTIGGALCSIQGFYVLNNGSVYAAPQRGKTGTSTYTIDLNNPGERLERISGYASPYNSNPSSIIIKGISFHTNHRTLGLYGKAEGTYFSSPASKGIVLGLWGRNGDYVDTIGIHIRYD